METTSKPVRNKGDRLLWAKITTAADLDRYDAGTGEWDHDSPYEHKASLYPQRYAWDGEEMTAGTAYYTDAPVRHAHPVPVGAWVAVTRRAEHWDVVAPDRAVLLVGPTGTTKEALLAEREAVSALGDALRVINIGTEESPSYRPCLDVNRLYIGSFKAVSADSLLDPDDAVPLSDFIDGIDVGTSETPEVHMALKLGAVNALDIDETPDAPKVGPMPVRYYEGALGAPGGNNVYPRGAYPV